jgi:DNA-binding CsgD family transcriptional regulator
VLNVTIDEDEFVTSATPQVITSDVEVLLRHFVERLVEALPEPDMESGGDGRDGAVLLDAEVGDVRIFAVRRGEPNPTSLLSPREQEIARMVASGYPNKTIASVLEISSWTVASHLRRIFVKLQVSSRAAMVTRLSGLALGELSPNHIDPAARTPRPGSPRPKS